MDIEMPEMNGITATREIHASDPQSKICIVTSYDDADLREEAAQAGAANFANNDFPAVFR